MSDRPLNAEATTKLTKQFLEHMEAHYRAMPTSRASVLEILNALAAATAYVLSGCDQDATKFFLDALQANTISGIEQRDEQNKESSQ